MALVVPSLCVGGAERHVVKLCRALPPSAVDIRVILLRRGLPAPLEADLPANVPVIWPRYGHRDPRVVPWLARVFRRERVDVAHSLLWYADAMTALAALGSPRLAVVASERGDRSFPYHTANRRRFDRLLTFRRAQALAANSAFGRALLVGLGAPPSRTLVLSNGVSLDEADTAATADLRSQFGWAASTTVITSVTRLVPGKGLATLIEAVALASRRADVCAVLVGDGPLRGGLEAQAAALGVRDRIGFLGTVRTVAPAFKGADGAVLLSEEREHCSNSILEAMACARPVIATDIGGNPELIRAGEDGWLVGPGDAAAVAMALESLAADRERAHRMGAAARSAVTRRYDIRIVADAHLALWRELAARRV